MSNIKELLGRIPPQKKDLANIIIILYQSYRDDSPLLETELREIKSFVDKALDEIAKRKEIGYNYWKINKEIN